MGIKNRLIVMSFLQFFIWGSWLISLGGYLGRVLNFEGGQIGSIFATLGIASLIMPGIIGIIADKWINAESLLTEFRFILASRDDIDIEELFAKDAFLQRHRKQFIFLPPFASRISSTSFRETFDPTYVDPLVYEYIKLHGLYRG